MSDGRPNPEELASTAQTIIMVRVAMEVAVSQYLIGKPVRAIRQVDELVRRRLLSDSPETLNEVGAVLGVSRERVRLIEVALLAILRAKIGAAKRVC